MRRAETLLLSSLGSVLLAACAGPEYVPPKIERPSGPLSLEAAVELCLRNSPDLEAADQRILMARSAVDEAIAAYWPALQLVESFTATNTPSQAFAMQLDQRRFSLAGDLNNPEVTTNWRTGVGASFTLYDGGRRRARWQASLAAAQGSVARAEGIRRDLALEVARAYFTYLKARETAEDQEKSIETLGAHVRIAEARLAAGTARKSDVLAVKVRLAETSEASIVAKNAAERALAGMRVLLGLDVEDPLELLPPADLAVGPARDHPALLDLARAHRWELVVAAAEVAAAEARVREAVAGYHPEVTLFGGFGFDDDAIADFEYGNWSWGASFFKDVFDIFRTPNRVRLAVAARDAAMASARKARLEVELDVKNATLDGEEADARHRVATQAVELAEESLRLVEAEYQEGAATVTRLLDAELALTQARTRLDATAYDRALARIALAHAVGEYPEPPAAPDGPSSTPKEEDPS